MDLVELRKKLELTSNDLSVDQLIDKANKIYDKQFDCINDLDKFKNRWSIISMEEMAECQQAISKQLRGKGNDLNLSEEIADVIFSCFVLTKIYNIDIDDIKKIINIKMNRVLDSKGEFK